VNLRVDERRVPDAPTELSTVRNAQFLKTYLFRVLVFDSETGGSWFPRPFCTDAYDELSVGLLQVAHLTVVNFSP
jgi:hypothetical protein